MKLKMLGKILVSTLVPVIIGTASLTYIASFLASDGIYDVTDIQLFEFAKKQASEIDMIMKNTISLGDMLDSDSDIEHLSLMANRLGSSRKEDPAFLALQKEVNSTFQELTEDFTDVKAVVLIAKDGKMIGFSAPSLENFDASYYKATISAFKGESMVESRVSQSTGKMSAMVASPVTADGSTETADAVLLLVTDLAAISDATIKDVKLMPTSSLFLLDNDGIMLMERSFPELIGKDNSIYDYVKVVLSERNGITRYDWEGVPKVTHFAELPTTKWVLGVETDESDFYTLSNEITMVLALASLVILLVVGGIIYVVVRKIVLTVSQGADIAAYVAEGNLTLKAEQQRNLEHSMQGHDEVATLSTALNTMLGNLGKMFKESEEKSKQAEAAAADAALASKEAEKSAQEAEEKRESILRAVAELEGIVNNITVASEQLSAQIQASTVGAEEQSARMAETATAMEEMNSTVLEVARNSGNSAEIADSTKGKALEGAEITNRCQSSMTQVKAESLKLRENMNELASHAQSISAVMGVISDIADQTNLLALNAAIEAARAGEAGRGFAVVADEVRKLAEKTIASTSDVANAINSIQQSTEKNVQQVDTAVARIEEATELAVGGGEALQGILGMAEESADGIRAIATASEQQSATSDEIASSIATVASIANDTVTAMNEATRAVSLLTEQSQQLARLVESLKNS